MTYSPTELLRKQFSLKLTTRPTANYVQGTQSSVQPNLIRFTYPRFHVLHNLSGYNALRIVKVQARSRTMSSLLSGILFWSNIAIGEKQVSKIILNFL
ncbi:hypothetical protein [Mastigocladopsis repens]|uniref:hypothetical protein n=1 Tax=Mastigocladopsis repens TaxID=221287 RepID=UPI0002D378E6|nr:hypothetical protein [Mastigocladopsis repens]